MHGTALAWFITANAHFPLLTGSFLDVGWGY